MPSFLTFLQQQISSLLLHPFFFTLLPLLLIFCLIKKWNISTADSCKSVPPSPPTVPLLGHMQRLGLHPHRSLQKLAKKYGPLMQLQLGSVKALVVSSADAAEEIMKTQDLNFAKQMKSICVRQLLSNKRVHSIRHIRDEETELMKKIKEPFPNAVNLSELFMTLTNAVLSRAAFGKKYSEGGSGMRFRSLMKEFVGLLGGFDFGTFLPWLGWIDRVNGLKARVNKVAKEMDEFLEGVLEEHLNGDRDNVGNNKGVSGEDFADVLLGIHKNNVAGVSIDRDAVKALLLDILAGGTDTTYTVLEWAMTELLRQSIVLRDLQNEVRGIVAGRTKTTENDLGKMKYLKAVIKETLRLHPPIPILIPRTAMNDTQVINHKVAAGTMVIINAWAIQRDPELWDEPEEFKPERFLNFSIDFRGHDFKLIPFGAGRRGCPGISFAIATNETVLANLMLNFDWELPNGGMGIDLDMTECTGLTIHRNVPLLAAAIPTK